MLLVSDLSVGFGGGGLPVEASVRISGGGGGGRPRVGPRVARCLLLPPPFPSPPVSSPFFPVLEAPEKGLLPDFREPS